MVYRNHHTYLSDILLYVNPQFYPLWLWLFAGNAYGNMFILTLTQDAPFVCRERLYFLWGKYVFFCVGKTPTKMWIFVGRVWHKSIPGNCPYQAYQHYQGYPCNESIFSHCPVPPLSSSFIISLLLRVHCFQNCLFHLFTSLLLWCTTTVVMFTTSRLPWPKRQQTMLNSLPLCSLSQITP